MQDLDPVARSGVRGLVTLIGALATHQSDVSSRIVGRVVAVCGRNEECKSLDRIVSSQGVPPAPGQHGRAGLACQWRHNGGALLQDPHVSLTVVPQPSLDNPALARCINESSTTARMVGISDTRLAIESSLL